MKIVISPAKSLDYSTELPFQHFTQPSFIKQSKEVHKELKELNPNDLKGLMSISDALADLNWKRNKERVYKLTEIKNEVRQAVYAFNGDVYTGLDAYTLKENQLEYLQKNLRILSGLYGYLKPLDVIEPYRLEMGTKLPVENGKNLYEFWKNTVTQSLLDELTTKEVIVNLASNEYFKVIDTKAIPNKIITPDFKDCKNGKLKTISFFAKKARGQMTRFMAENNINK